MHAVTEQPRVRKWVSALRRDDGMALATVVAISMVLFLLASTLVMLATQGQVAASNQAQRTKALAAADAAIDAYVYQASIQTFPGTLSGSTAEAAWTVTAPPRAPGSMITTLTAIGTIPAKAGAPATTRKIIATVRSASFSDYMFLLNEYFNLGPGGLVKGNVRSNDYVNNDGEITGYVYAGGDITGSGTFDKHPLYPNYGTQSFAVVPYGSLMATAVADGTYYPNSGTFGSGLNTRHYLGYCVTLAGTGGTITKVRSIDTGTGAMVVDAYKTFTIPGNGVLYFDDPVWLSGTYSSKVTVVVGKDVEGPGGGDHSPTGREYPGPSGMNPASSTGSINNANSSVFIWNNLQSQDPSNPDQVCGIVTMGDISFTSEYPNAVTPTNLTIQAAMLSSMGSIHADWTTNKLKNHLKILGAEAALDQGFIKYGSYTGFDTRDYWYDPNLDINTPPNFPILGDNKVHVRSWIEQ